MDKKVRVINPIQIPGVQKAIATKPKPGHIVNTTMGTSGVLLSDMTVTLTVDLQKKFLDEIYKPQKTFTANPFVGSGAFDASKISLSSYSWPDIKTNAKMLYNRGV